MDSRKRILDLMVRHNAIAAAWPGGDGPTVHAEQQKITAELVRIAREIAALQAQDNAD